MPAPEDGYRPQEALLWPASDSNDYAEPTVTAYAVVNVLVANTKDRTSTENNKVTREINVIVDREIAIGSTMYLGTEDEWLGTGSGLTDANNEVMHVRQYFETPDVKQRFIRRRVVLMKYRDSPPVS